MYRLSDFRFKNYFLLFIEKFHVIAKITLFTGIGKLLAAFFLTIFLIVSTDEVFYTLLGEINIKISLA